jgi:hypothetical protein
VCPSCGEHLSRPARFCHHCGAWLQHGFGAEGRLPPPPAAEGPTWPCPRCQYPSPRQVNFCANCGLRLNQAPLDKKEAKQRKQQADQAKLTPDQEDRSTLRTNVVLVSLGVVVLAADISFLVLYPGFKAAYLGPVAALLVLRMSMAVTTIKRTRARIRSRASNVSP